jgi:hypothetical protein
VASEADADPQPAAVLHQSLETPAGTKLAAQVQTCAGLGPEPIARVAFAGAASMRVSLSGLFDRAVSAAGGAAQTLRARRQQKHALERVALSPEWQAAAVAERARHEQLSGKDRGSGCKCYGCTGRAARTTSSPPRLLAR